jgi:hypothetical protein
VEVANATVVAVAIHTTVGRTELAGVGEAVTCTVFVGSEMATRVGPKATICGARVTGVLVGDAVGIYGVAGTPVAARIAGGFDATSDGGTRVCAGESMALGSAGTVESWSGGGSFVTA